MSSGFDRRHLLKGAGSGMVMAVLAGTDPLSAAAVKKGAGKGSAAVDRSGGAFSAHQTITELVPGRLYRIGCMVKAQRLSWLAHDLPGYEPVNAYLLTDANNAVFFEMGLPIARPAMEQAVNTLVGNRRVFVDFSRNEADCIGNMGYLLGTCKSPTLLYGTAGGILEWINDPHVSELEVLNFLGRIPIESAKNGETKKVGDLEMTWLDAGSKMMLMTQWMYEKSTGTLFTSESFGWRHSPTLDTPVVVESAKDMPSVDTVAHEMVARMNWMRESTYPKVIDRFASIFQKYDVQMIAPVHGRVIKGREAVAAHVELAVAAMTAAAKLPDMERLQYA